MADQSVTRKLAAILSAGMVGYSQPIVSAGVILVTSSPAFARHYTVGRGAAIGAAPRSAQFGQ
jgi:hypothetical protein